MRPDSLPYKIDRVRYRLMRERVRGRSRRLYREMLPVFDTPEFRERFRPYWDPFPGATPAKYLDLETWLREAAWRASLQGLDSKKARTEPKRVLDLGCGTGYFLACARHLGHDVLGLDVDDEPLYNEMVSFLDLPRITHRIRPHQPLPEMPHSFDLITAYMAVFNEHEDGTPWGAGEWSVFLEELRAILAPGGRIVIRFNLNRTTGEFYSSVLHTCFINFPDLRPRFFLDSVVFQPGRALEY